MTDFPLYAVCDNVVNAITAAVATAGESYTLYATLSVEHTSSIATDPISILVSLPEITLKHSTCQSGGVSCAQAQYWKIAVFVMMYWSEGNLENYLVNIEKLDSVINLVNDAVKNLETPVAGSIKLPALEPALVGQWGETDNHNVIIIGFESDRYN